MTGALTPDESLIASLTPERSAEILDSLTKRQHEVMVELVYYRERKEIARDLGVSYTRVTQLLEVVREKFDILHLSSLKFAFLVASYQCDRPVFKEKQLRSANVGINELVSTGRYGELHELLVEPDFKAFIRDRRSPGWRALDAWLGPGWRPIAIMLVAATAITIVVAMFVASDWLTERMQPGPSSPILETRPMNVTKPQMMSNEFHAIEAEARALQERLAEQLVRANQIAKDKGLSPVQTQRTTRHLAAAILSCDEMIASAGLSHAAAQKLGETRADIPWRCPDAVADKPNLTIVG